MSNNIYIPHKFVEFNNTSNMSSDTDNIQTLLKNNFIELQKIKLILEKQSVEFKYNIELINTINKETISKLIFELLTKLKEYTMIELNKIKELIYIQTNLLKETINIRASETQDLIRKICENNYKNELNKINLDNMLMKFFDK
jgi:hypothetical protein